MIVDIISAEPNVPPDPIDIPNDNFLFNFVKQNNIENYHIMRAWKIEKNHQQTIDRGRWVVFDKDTKLFYKIVLEPFLNKDSFTFLNNAHFRNHIVSVTQDDYLCVIKSTNPQGDIFSNILLTSNFISDEKLLDNIIDGILDELKWVQDESKRIFPDKKDLYLDANFDWHGPNMMYDIETENVTSIDLEPLWWHYKEEFVWRLITRLTTAFFNWTIYPGFNPSFIYKCPPHTKLEDKPAEHALYGKKLTKKLDHCIDFIEQKIL